MIGSSNDEYDINDGGGDDDDDDDIDDLRYANSGGNIKRTRQNVDSLTDEYHTDFKPELDPFYYTGDNTIPTTISDKDASYKSLCFFNSIYCPLFLRCMVLFILVFKSCLSTKQKFSIHFKY
jgi:hypothetical protein